MNSDSIVRHIEESMCECLTYAKKAGGNPDKFTMFMTRARRWQVMLSDYMSEQEAQGRFLQAYRDILGQKRAFTRN
jgi:3-hydroxyisobutyrate dehydrogenase-like beta-hydroxyacid dehydrogenase